jgi:hypothetical protein
VGFLAALIAGPEGIGGTQPTGLRARCRYLEDIKGLSVTVWGHQPGMHQEPKTLFDSDRKRDYSNLHLRSHHTKRQKFDNIIVDRNC